jgi:GT2 family glycosyltransferase
MAKTEVSVVTVVSAVAMADLRHCLKSTKAPGVEHILVLAGLSGLLRFVAVKLLAMKYRATLKLNRRPLPLSEALNIGASVSHGSHLVFTAPTDYLLPNWWKSITPALKRSDFIYSDSLLVDDFGAPLGQVLNPAWSPVRLESEMFASHLMIIRKSIFDHIGGFKKNTNLALDHDLALRASCVTELFEHIPLVIAARRAEDKGPKRETSKNPIRDFRPTDSEHGTIMLQETNQTEPYPWAESTGQREDSGKRSDAISIVIPTAFKSQKNGVLFIDSLLDSLMPFLDIKRGDQVVIVHGGEDQSALKARESNKLNASIISVQDRSSFNFSRRCNIGFLNARNEYVLLLNDDIEFGNQNPLNILLRLIKARNVGLVGGLLLFPDQTIQHAGHTFTDRNPHHLYYGKSLSSMTVKDLPSAHEVVGVTGALMFQSKAVWRAVGGFSTNFPLNYNDVDYCQKIRILGYRVIQANSVVAFHHGSATRNPSVQDHEKIELRRRWPTALSWDPFSRIKTKIIR